MSVIIIFLNEEKCIGEAIESVLAQTSDQWELLLVDDGSTDGSSAIARAYAEKMPGRIRYLEHPGHENRGMSASRNLGIERAESPYISFLDADDIWLPQKLEQQLPVLEAHPEVAMVCGRAQWWYSWTGQPEDQNKDFIQEFSLPLNTLVDGRKVLNMFLLNEWASLHDVLLRRAAVEEVGGYENAFRGMFEDQAFHAKLCLSYPIYISGTSGYLYRQHPAACTTQSHATGRYLSARKTYLYWLQDVLINKGEEGGEVWQVVQQQLWPFKHPVLYRMKNGLLDLGRKIMPQPLRHWLWTQWHFKPSPPVGWVRWGSLRRLTPISPVWPNHRGAPVDRYYIEKFLAANAEFIQGRVLELGDATYTRRFGGARVTGSDVLHGREGNPAATIVSDLTVGENIPSDSFDCIILTQTLLLIYDVRAAIRTLHRILKPGGVLLVTVPGITQIIRDDMEEYGQYWSFTRQSAEKLFSEVFTEGEVVATTFGNVLSTTAFLYGLGAQELSQRELDHHDRDYQLIIGVRVTKAGES